MFVATPEGIEYAHRIHKLGVLMGIEGGHSIENSIPLLRQYYALGVRYMTLTWSNSNGWADSSGDIDDKSVPHTKEGLTEFGKDVVYEMNRLGMMVDISHVSDRTFFRTLIISRAPVIASHSSAPRPLRRAAQHDRRHAPRHRQLRRSQLQGRRRPGQLLLRLPLPALPRRLKHRARSDKAIQEFKDKAKAEGKQATHADTDKIQRQFADRIPRPPLSVLIDHIDHIAKVAGVDHVGLGSDFDGVGGQLPEGLDSAADLPKITAALMERGYSAEDCRKILGGNLLRVFREVEQVAHQLQAENRPRITNKQPYDEWKK